MPGTLDEDSWTTLVHMIKTGRCTPFLGAGACYGTLPLGSDLAQEWAAQYGYTYGNCTNLLEVAQFLAMRFGPVWAKDLVRQKFAGVGPPNFSEPDEPHQVLAQLPLSVYLTTNYDDFLFQAFSRTLFRKPVRDFCRWHTALADLTAYPSPLTAAFEPHPANPLVFHLHGMLGTAQTPLSESLVLTEDDYIAFLASLVRQEELLPPLVKRSLRDNMCLFIGYRLADWNFRILFEGLRNQLSGKSIAVLLPPGKSPEEQEAARRYFEQYYRRALNVDVFWGTSREFCRELLKRLPH